MLDNNDVGPVMGMVSRALAEAGKTDGQPSVHFVDVTTSGELRVNTLRRQTEIRIETPSGPARPGIRPVVLFGKRVFRRGVRWYVKPMMAQQSTFNSAVLDVLHGQILMIDKLTARVEFLEEQIGQPRRTDSRDRVGGHDSAT